MNKERRVVFTAGVRTPFGRMGGGLKTYYPSELLGMAIAALVRRTGIQERAQVDLHSLPKGVYAVQLTTEDAFIKGSTLIRR